MKPHQQANTVNGLAPAAPCPPLTDPSSHHTAPRLPTSNTSRVRRVSLPGGDPWGGSIALARDARAQHHRPATTSTTHRATVGTALYRRCRNLHNAEQGRPRRRERGRRRASATLRSGTTMTIPLTAALKRIEQQRREKPETSADRARRRRLAFRPRRSPTTRRAAQRSRPPAPTSASAVRDPQPHARGSRARRAST